MRGHSWTLIGVVGLLVWVQIRRNPTRPVPTPPAASRPASGPVITRTPPPAVMPPVELAIRPPIVKQSGARATPLAAARDDVPEPPSSVIEIPISARRSPPVSAEPIASAYYPMLLVCRPLLDVTGTGETGRRLMRGRLADIDTARAAGGFGFDAGRRLEWAEKNHLYVLLDTLPDGSMDIVPLMANTTDADAGDRFHFAPLVGRRVLLHGCWEGNFVRVSRIDPTD